jgi:predicted enzyme related to lactoylglutathione lyase
MRSILVYAFIPKNASFRFMSDSDAVSSGDPSFHGPRTVVYVVDDVEAGAAWYAKALGIEPYFEEPYYVGFNVGGYELGLQPAEGDSAPGQGGTIAYWGVDDADAAVERLVRLGATPHEGVQDVGDGIRLGTVLDPFGNVLGVIHNPNFEG